MIRNAFSQRLRHGEQPKRGERLLRFSVIGVGLAAVPIVLLAAPPKAPTLTSVNDQTVHHHDHHGHHGHDHEHLPYIDHSTIPAPVEGHADYRVRATTQEPYPDAGGVGAVRTICQMSHFNFDDSLVYPGVPNASHLHMYFGNTAANAFLTSDNILDQGNSTCRGGIANRSAYWVPAIIDTSDGAVIPMRVAHVYYKTGYRGVRDEDIQPPPKGMRMIVGDMSRTAEWEWGPFEFRCEGKRSFSIPECRSGDLLVIINFPQCWDGQNLYREDQSHVTRARNGCPPSHPVPLPELSYNMHFPIPEGRTTANWRLSSDNYSEGPGGYSMHADWINGWDPDLPPVWTSEIINLGLSGGSYLIGGGQMTY